MSMRDAALVGLATHLGGSMYHGCEEGVALTNISYHAAQAYVDAFRPKTFLAPMTFANTALLVGIGLKTGSKAAYAAAAVEFGSHFAMTAAMSSTIRHLRNSNQSEKRFRKAADEYFKLNWGRTAGVALAIGILLYFGKEQ